MATMSDADRDKWDTRYRTGDYVPHWKPSPFLVDSLAVIPPGRALDVACGARRNALHLADAGFEMNAFDISKWLGPSRNAAD